MNSLTPINTAMPPNPPPASVGQGDSRPRVPLSQLLPTGGELVILHDGQEYVLRLTSNGKLLLTK